MSGTLDKPEVTHHEYWDSWGVNAGYYGTRGPASFGRYGLRDERVKQFVWVIESIKPNTKHAAEASSLREAEELLSLADWITEDARDKTASRPTGIVAAVLPYEPNAHRLRAEKIDGGWRISDYDFRAWSFDLPTSLTQSSEVEFRRHPEGAASDGRNRNSLPTNGRKQ